MFPILIVSLGFWFIAYSNAINATLPQDQSSQRISTILTKVTTSNGTDISSGFQTMIFQETPRATLSNLTDRQAPWFREISSCRHETATFQYSYCRKHKYTAADMRAYTVVCKAPPPGPGYFSPRTIIEHGFCTYNEMCMDGPKDTNRSRERPLPTKASCIGESSFLPADQFLYYQRVQSLNLEKHRRAGQLMFSSPDKTKPLQAQYIDVSTISHNVTDLQISRHDSSCKDCSSLTVPQRDEPVDLLKTQATMQGATAGILWLAFFSGATLG